MKMPAAAYYPKLAMRRALHQPVTGRRFLTRPGFEAQGMAALIQGAGATGRRGTGCPRSMPPSATRPRRWPAPRWACCTGSASNITGENRDYADWDALPRRSEQPQAQRPCAKERADGAGLRRAHRATDRRCDPARPLGGLLASSTRIPARAKWGRPYLTRAFFEIAHWTACATTSCWSWPSGTAIRWPGH